MMYQLRRDLFEKELLTRFDERNKYGTKSCRYDNELRKIYEEDGLEKVVEIIRERHSSDFFDLKEFRKQLGEIKEKEFSDYKGLLEMFSHIKCGGRVRFEYKAKTLYAYLKGEKLFTFKLYQLKKNTTDYVAVLKTGKDMEFMDRTNGNSSMITEVLSSILQLLEKVIGDKILVMAYLGRYVREDEIIKALGDKYQPTRPEDFIEKILLDYIGNPVISKETILYLCNDGTDNLNNSLENHFNELLQIGKYLDDTALLVNGCKEKGEMYYFEKKYLKSSITLLNSAYNKSEEYSVEKIVGENIRFRKIGSKDKKSLNKDEFIREVELLQKEWAEEVYLRMLVDPPVDGLREMLMREYEYEDTFIMKEPELKAIFGNLMRIFDNDSNAVLKCIHDEAIQRNGVVGKYKDKKYIYTIFDLEDGKIIIDLIGKKENDSDGKETLVEIGVNRYENEDELKKHIQNTFCEMVKKTPFEFSKKK